MKTLFGWLFSSPGFMPHGHCYLWQPGTLWLNVGSDGLIASAYFAIPFALYHLVRERRTEIPYPGILLMFAAFILLCGSTHLMEIWTVWRPDYRLAGVLKALTGIVSVATMIALFHVIPKAMLLRGPEQLKLEVQSRTAELARVNDKLREEISARDLAETQLRELDRRKDEFLATLAHELRNPLAPIRHAVKLLGTDLADADRQRWGRDVIARQAHRMALLLDDLLDVSRITRGRIELKRERVKLRTLVDSAVETVRPAIEAKRHELTISLPDRECEIEADPLRLSQSISNLLTNAAKFTPAGGRLSVSVSITADDLMIAVSDSGVGFDRAQIPLLFEMFSQADGRAADGEGGLGIGLALVKGLVELHGGQVRAESPGKGLGSTFTVLLPASAVVSASRPSQDPAEASDAKMTTILVADDNRDAADSMGVLLELSGHQVLVAHSGSRAIEMGREHRPKVVILDIGMPDLSGYEVARRIRTEDWGKDVFLMAITGWGQADDKERARNAGFDSHLTKPVDIEVVEGLVADFLRSRTI